MSGKRWSYSAGAWGASRVRAYEDKRGGILVECYERDPARRTPQRVRFSLGHRDRRRARRTVHQLVAALERGEAVVAEAVTLRQLFDIYLREVTPTKAVNSQRHDRMCVTMFMRCFGPSRRVNTLSRRDWDHFIGLRRAGASGPTGRPLGNRQIEYDLKFLRAVFNWALGAKEGGTFLLARNPFSGKAYRLPREKNPRRPVMTEAQYQTLRRLARAIDWRFELALVLANETGHRQSAIRLLRWSDIDRAAGRIRWRAAHEKTGYEHETPLSRLALEALERARTRSGGIGDAWVFPSPRTPEKPLSRRALDRWLALAQRQAGLDPLGWHSLRRKFATELTEIPLKDLCTLGGWKDPTTVLSCYQVPDLERMRRSLEARRPLGTRGAMRQTNRQS